MKVIFLDNDCVICLQNNWGKRDKLMKEYLKDHPGTYMDKIPVSHRFDGFDKKAVKVLNRILESTGAEIVVSSDWKLHASLEELQEYYLAQGIAKSPIAMTPNMKDFDPESCGLFQWKGWLSKIRVSEIRKYLEEHQEVTSWVAIDDLPMGFDGLENFFMTDDAGMEGIKKTGLAEKIIASLS
jgi:hypothetical protein